MEEKTQLRLACLIYLLVILYAVIGYTDMFGVQGFLSITLISFVGILLGWHIKKLGEIK